MSPWSRRLLVSAALVAVPLIGLLAQTPPMHPGMHPQAAPPGAARAPQPTLPGQDAFGAIQEIVRMLEADASTDWSRVDLRALREHLIDMNEVTLRAVAIEQEVPGGLEVLVTGQGRTLDAIRRMVPAHSHELDQINGWHAVAAPVENGVRLTVTSNDPREVAHLRGLGFIGVMVSGNHHQPHHLAIARGELHH